MFTRISNFTYGNYSIPNIESITVNNNVALLIAIQKFEMQGLRMVVGDCLVDEFLKHIEVDSNGYYVLKSGADAKWGWLLNGHTYDSVSFCSGCGKVAWKGLVYKVANVKGADVFESVLAPYIFYNWSLEHRTINTGVGEAKGIADGTIAVSSNNKRVDAWNDFVNQISYSANSLYRFLSDHRAEFPEFRSKCLNVITYWDI